MRNLNSADRCTPEQERLVQEHLPLVHHVVQGMRNRIPGFVPMEDLESAALFAMYQASRTYDPAHGVPFEHWARLRMNGEVIDELRSRDWAGRVARTEIKRVQRAVDGLTQQLGRTPDRSEVASATCIDLNRLHQVLDDEHSSVILHLDSVFSTAGGEEVLAGPDSDLSDGLLRRELHAYLRDAVVMLPERLRRVVVGYYFEERPMAELAEELEVTESRVSQMRAEAVALLREGVQSQLSPSEKAGAETPKGRVARRKAAYFAAISTASDFRSRLSVDAPTVQERVAQVG